MLRRCALRCASGPAGLPPVGKATVATASSTSPSTAGTTRPDVEGKTKNIFNLRRAPKSLYEDSMHSNTLTDHPLTHRTNRDELAYRKRKLTERGEFEQAAAAEVEAEERDRGGRGGAEVREYYWAITVIVVGYLTAHKVVYSYYFSEDVRPNYAPDRGYSDDVAARRKQLQDIDEFIGLTVLDAVFDQAKGDRKRKSLMTA